MYNLKILKCVICYERIKNLNEAYALNLCGCKYHLKCIAKHIDYSMQAPCSVRGCEEKDQEICDEEMQEIRERLNEMQNKWEINNN